MWRRSRCQLSLLVSSTQVLFVEMESELVLMDEVLIDMLFDIFNSIITTIMINDNYRFEYI